MEVKTNQEMEISQSLANILRVSKVASKRKNPQFAQTAFFWHKKKSASSLPKCKSGSPGNKKTETVRYEFFASNKG